jgi:hypothetical protein
MVHCVGCHGMIDPNYSFCPMCGVDNRPPDRRPQVPKHDHVFTNPTTGRCILCGAKHVADRVNINRPTVLIGLGVLILGVLIAIDTIVTVQAVRTGSNLDWVYGMHHGNKVPNKDLIRESWGSAAFSLFMIVFGSVCIIFGLRGEDLRNEGTFSFWSK